jgi:hypothetical protein
VERSFYVEVKVSKFFCQRCNTVHNAGASSCPLVNVNEGTKFVCAVPKGAGRVVAMTTMKDYKSDETIVLCACEYAIYRVFPDRIEPLPFVDSPAARELIQTCGGCNGRGYTGSPPVKCGICNGRGKSN